MIITFGFYWLPILLTLILVGYIWYWSACHSRHAIRKLNDQRRTDAPDSWELRNRQRD